MPSKDTRSTWLTSKGDPPSKQAILDAALRLFVRYGLAGTSIRMIGTEAGYTNPALFKFFPSKDALALHLFKCCYRRLYQRILPVTRVRFEAGLNRLIDAFLEQTEEDLEVVLFVQDSLRELWPRLPTAAREHSILDTLGKLVSRGMREGTVVGYHSVDVPVAAMVGLLTQFARMVYFGEIETPVRRHRNELQLALFRMLAT